MFVKYLAGSASIAMLQCFSKLATYESMQLYALYIYIYIYIYIVHAYTPVCIYIHTCMHACIRTYIYIHMYSYIHTYIHTYAYIHTYVHICIHNYIATITLIVVSILL